jgi:hypothetical protein
MVVAAFLAASAQERGAARVADGGPQGAAAVRPNLHSDAAACRWHGEPGRVAGEKGIWNVPYITNMGMRVVDDSGKSVAPQAEPGGRGRAGGAPLGGGEGTAGGGRGGTKSEPWVPFQPWAAAVYDYNSVNQSKYDPEGYCLPPGGPRMFATPYPAEIIQLPEQKRIIMIFEGATHIWREIFMDVAGIQRATGLTDLPGHSVGHWEGDTLVVDVVGFNEATWLDYFGHPHTDQLHVVERHSRPNADVALQRSSTNAGAYTGLFKSAWDIPGGGECRAVGIHLPGKQQVTRSV